MKTDSERRMRRAIVTLCLVLASLAAFPSRADAFFWGWLDDLSGPKFWGIQVDWQVWCRTNEAKIDLRVLQEARRLIGIDNTQLFAFAAGRPAINGTSSPALTLFNIAAAEGGFAITAITEAEKALGQGDTVEAARLYRGALSLWNDASEHFTEGVAQLPATSLQEASALQALLKARRQQRGMNPKIQMVGMLVSLCDAKPVQETTRFVTFHYGFGWDRKNAIDQNRMVTVGLSLHSVIKPYLTIGAGGGIASFSGDNAAAFSKVYIQPAIIDIRPFAMVHGDDAQWAPARQLIMVRVDGMVFPTGFEPGRFGGNSPRFKTEFVPSVGVHFDLTPFVRKWQGVGKER